MPAMKDMVNGVPRYRHFINGQWTDSTVKEWIEVENPATGAVIATVPKGSADDADRALVAAAAAGGGGAGQAAGRGARRDRGHGALSHLRGGRGAAHHRRHHPVGQPG